MKSSRNTARQLFGLTLTLVGCTGDRVKQGMNSPSGMVVKNVSQSAAWSRGNVATRLAGA